ncbi:hypothetical protein D3C74_54120 [compost metagenome]
MNPFMWSLWDNQRLLFLDEGRLFCLPESHLTSSGESFKIEGDSVLALSQEENHIETQRRDMR